MRYIHLIKAERFVFLFLHDYLASQLHRFYVICDVVEIDGHATFLIKLYAFDSDLVKLLLLLLQLEDAVLLVWLILLGYDDLFKTQRF